MAVVGIEVKSRVSLAGGRAFGAVGRYLQLDGTAHFAVDPPHPRNRVITDIGLITFQGADGLTVMARSLATALPAPNVELSLVARNNEALLTYADGRIIQLLDLSWVSAPTNRGGVDTVRKDASMNFSLSLSLGWKQLT